LNPREVILISDEAQSYLYKIGFGTKREIGKVTFQSIPYFATRLGISYAVGMGADSQGLKLFVD
jgi:hypothetical protein